MFKTIVGQMSTIQTILLFVLQNDFYRRANGVSNLCKRITKINAIKKSYSYIQLLSQ